MQKLILIVDDNGLVRQLLRTMLESLGGWEVADTANGPEAILKVQELKPDAVILDLVMPVMNGIATAREIARVLPSVPILLLTLYGSPEASLAAKEVGVARVLSKTEIGMPLIRAVQELLATEVPPPKSFGAAT